MDLGINREQMGIRVARELREGMFVNLGIGMPAYVGNFIPKDIEVILHSENGVLGYGKVPEESEQDMDLVGAGGQPLSLVPGACFLDSADSFALIRGGRLDVAILGAYQVSEKGDLANWMKIHPRDKHKRRLGSVGGAMDLTSGAKQVWVMMEHCTTSGEPRILYDCTYPLTAKQAVTMIFTNLAVIQVASDGLTLKEVAPGVAPDVVQSLTEPRLLLADGLKEMTF